MDGLQCTVKRVVRDVWGRTLPDCGYNPEKQQPKPQSQPQELSQALQNTSISNDNNNNSNANSNNNNTVAIDESAKKDGQPSNSSTPATTTNPNIIPISTDGSDASKRQSYHHLHKEDESPSDEKRDDQGVTM